MPVWANQRHCDRIAHLGSSSIRSSLATRRPSRSGRPHRPSFHCAQLACTHRELNRNLCSGDPCCFAASRNSDVIGSRSRMYCTAPSAPTTPINREPTSAGALGHNRSLDEEQAIACTPSQINPTGRQVMRKQLYYEDIITSCSTTLTSNVETVCELLMQSRRFAFNAGLVGIGQLRSMRTSTGGRAVVPQRRLGEPRTSGS
jgi:hypothetical protein